MTQAQFMHIIKKMDLSEEAVSIIDSLSSKLINKAYNDGWNDAAEYNNKKFQVMDGLIHQKKIKV